MGARQGLVEHSLGGLVVHDQGIDLLAKLVVAAARFLEVHATRRLGAFDRLVEDQLGLLMQIATHAEGFLPASMIPARLG